MFVESAHGDTITGPSGWNAGPVVPTAANASVDTQLQVFYKVSTGGDPTTVSNSSGDHVIARIIGITKDTYNAEIFEITQTSTELTADTSGSIQGLTTNWDETLILMGAAVGGDPASDNITSFSGHTNLNLTTLTERVDNGRIDGSGGHLVVYTAIKTLAGATGNTAFTSVPSAYKAMVCFAIRNPSEPGAFPVVAPSAVAVATQISSVSSSWTVNLPGSVAANDLLLVFVRPGGPQTINTPGGWTDLVNNAIDDGTDDNTSVFWKLAAGGETTVAVSFSAAAKGVAFAYRITGVDVTEPVAGGLGFFAATPSNANAQHNDANAGVIRNHLWISAVFLDGTTQTFAAPAGMSGLVQGNSGAGGTVASNVRGATCWQQFQNYHSTIGTYTNNSGGSGHTTLVVGIIPALPPITPKSGTDSGSGSETASVAAAAITDTDTGTSRDSFAYVDDFNRTNEGPPATGWQNWKQSGMSIISNQLAPTADISDTLKTGSQPPDVEAWIEIPTLPGGADSYIQVFARLEPVAVDGYSVQHYIDYLGVAGNDYINIIRWDDWVATLIGGSYNVHLDPGDAIGIRCAGSTIQALVRRSGKVEIVGAVTDATYIGDPYRRVALLHVGGGTTVARLDNFGAGSIPPTIATQDSREDTGTGTENAVLAFATAVTDTGTGADDSVIDKHVIPVSGSDTGASTDISILAVAFSVSDAGFPPLENGAVVIAPIVVGDDVGAGSEVISQFARSLPDFGGDTEAFTIATYVSDNGSGTEGITDLSRPLQDSGTGTENYAISKFADDAGVGSDNRVDTAQITSGDSSTGYEIILPASARYTQSDTVAGVDTALPFVIYSGSDSGAGTDTATVKAVVSGSDTGGLFSEVGALVYRITTSETGTAVEAPTLVARLTATDTGTAVETPLFSFLFVDSAIGSDVTAFSRVLGDFGGITEFYAISVAAPGDNGTSAEIISGFTRAAADLVSSVEDASISVGNERIGSESGSFVETALLVFKTTVVDSGLGNEISGSNTPVMGNDSGTFVEIFAIRTTLSDVALGEDITRLSRVLFDTGIGADGQTITAGNTRQDSDSGQGIENYILNKGLPISDSGTGTENGSLVASHIRLDSGSVSENTVSGAAPIRIDDNGAGTDQGSLRQYISASDSGHFTDKGHAGLFVVTKFHTSKLVTANGQKSKLAAANHPYYVRV